MTSSLVPLQGSANQYKGIVDCVKTIVAEEGPPALLKVNGSDNSF